MSQDNTNRPRIALVEVTDPKEKAGIMEFLAQLPFNSTVGHTDARHRMTKEQAQALTDHMEKVREGHQPTRGNPTGKASIIDIIAGIALEAMRSPYGQENPFQGCTGCDDDKDSTAIPETLEIAGMVLEGASLINIGTGTGIFDGATDEDKQVLKDRVKKARKQLKEVLQYLED